VPFSIRNLTSTKDSVAENSCTAVKSYLKSGLEHGDDKKIVRK
jgi:hypothetical protein